MLLISPFIVAIAALFCSISNDPSGYHILKEMVSSASSISSLSYSMKKTERINGKLLVQTSEVKLVKQPYKVYTRQLSPQKGVEVLFVKGENGNKAVINPNSFPWVNLYLDPYGSLMRSNQHHTIYDAGFDHFCSILSYLLKKYGESAASFINKDTITFTGIFCNVVNINNPNFKIIPYTVKKEETLQNISDKFRIGGYMIMELNPGVDSYTDVSEGQVINIPSDYAPRLTIYIDQARKIPLLIRVSDSKGLYEEYQFTKVKVNPVFKPEEFSADYAEYGF